MTNRKTCNADPARKVAIRALCAVVSMGFGQIAAAGGPGAGAHAGIGAQPGVGPVIPQVGIGIGARADAPAPGLNAPAPEVNLPAPNAKALENANGAFVEDRLFGRERARARMSEQGLAHQKADAGGEASAAGSASASTRK